MESTWAAVKLAVQDEVLRHALSCREELQQHGSAKCLEEGKRWLGPGSPWEKFTCPEERNALLKACTGTGCPRALLSDSFSWRKMLGRSSCPSRPGMVLVQ